MRSLRRGQTQLLICALQIAHLGVGQEVQDGAAIGVLVLHDVAGGVLHGVPRVTRLRRHVIAHLRDGGSVLAAAVCRLHLHSAELLHQRRLLVGAGQLGIAEAGQQRVVHGIEAVAQPAVDEIHLALDVGEVGGQHIAVHHAAGIASVVAPAVAAPAAERKQEQDDEEPRAVTAKAKAVTAAIGRGHRHGHGGHTFGKRHSITPFY